jgi:hypothetical protein
MSFLNFFRKRSIRPSWEFATKGFIWRLHPAEGGKLVGEERDVESKTASFFCLDLTVGAALWKEKNYGEQWWTGIETVHRDVIILHGFATPDLPEHKRLTAVDLGTGDQLWRNDEVKFVAAADGKIYASRGTIGGRIFLELDSRTGDLLRELGLEEEGDRSVPRGEAADVFDDVVFPLPLPEGASGTSPLSSLLHGVCTPAAVTGPVGYIDLDDRVVFGYHEQRLTASKDDVPSFTSLLAVVDRESGKLLLRVTIDDGVSFPVPDTFLVRTGFLYYIRNRRTLTAVPLRS